MPFILEGAIQAINKFKSCVHIHVLVVHTMVTYLQKIKYRTMTQKKGFYLSKFTNLIYSV